MKTVEMHSVCIDRPLGQTFFHLKNIELKNKELKSMELS